MGDVERFIGFFRCVYVDLSLICFFQDKIFLSSGRDVFFMVINDGVIILKNIGVDNLVVKVLVGEFEDSILKYIFKYVVLIDCIFC